MYTIKGAVVTITEPTGNDPAKVSIGGKEVEVKSTKFKDRIQDWINEVTKKDGPFAGYTISLDNYNENATPKPTVNIRITANESGVKGDTGYATANPTWTANDGSTITPVKTDAIDRVPGVAAEYVDELSAIRIPVDPTTGMQ